MKGTYALTLIKENTFSLLPCKHRHNKMLLRPRAQQDSKKQISYGSICHNAIQEGLFLKEGNPSASHELNKAIGRNFHFMVLHGTVLSCFMEQIFMELAVHSVIRPMWLVKLLPLRWEVLTFRLHSVSKLCFQSST